MYLSRFKSFDPPYLIAQEDLLRWLGQAHARHSREISSAQFTKLLQRYGCGPDKIHQRGSFLRDFTHSRWPEMQIFSGPEKSASTAARTSFFSDALLPAVRELYADMEPDFSQWLHVSCTGYACPSLIQNMVSERNWGKKIECLHAYHMGCYAAFPALRMARGLGECEIMHSELCTLHLDPTSHEPEQLVIQSLFADGLIRYRVGEIRPDLGWEMKAQREVIIPQTQKQMTWAVSSAGFKMTLAREVPSFVQQGVAAVVHPWQSAGCVYAIHPGGPRIIDAVKEALRLSEEQVHFSREILRAHGNMSSATLPRVWSHMLTQVPSGTPVISMAFGPGLTLSASLMHKVGP